MIRLLILSVSIVLLTNCSQRDVLASVDDIMYVPLNTNLKNPKSGEVQFGKWKVFGNKTNFNTSVSIPVSCKGKNPAHDGSCYDISTLKFVIISSFLSGSNDDLGDVLSKLSDTTQTDSLVRFSINSDSLNFEIENKYSCVQGILSQSDPITFLIPERQDSEFDLIIYYKTKNTLYFINSEFVKREGLEDLRSYTKRYFEWVAYYKSFMGILMPGSLFRHN